jgi:Fe-S-cluster containining protein
MSKIWKYFKCQQCGKCCEELGLPYDPERVYKIAAFLNISIDQLLEGYYGRISADRKSWEPQDDKRTPCPFLKSVRDKKTCEIYPVRPRGCRCYPLETDFGRNGVDCPAAAIVFDKL